MEKNDKKSSDTATSTYQAGVKELLRAHLRRIHCGTTFVYLITHPLCTLYSAFVYTSLSLFLSLPPFQSPLCLPVGCPSKLLFKVSRNSTINEIQRYHTIHFVCLASYFGSV